MAYQVMKLLIFHNLRSQCLQISSLFFGRTTQLAGFSEGIEPVPPAVETQSLNHWATIEVLTSPVTSICVCPILFLRRVLSNTSNTFSFPSSYLPRTPVLLPL